jgi:hypothetical protein
VEHLEIPELTSDQIEELCRIAEETARKFVYSKIHKKDIETLDISVEADGTKPVSLEVDVDVDLSPSIMNFNVQKLADEAVREAFKSAGDYLRELKCHSKT